ncbi:MAG: hypothetical protein R2834_23385, partial [Rhodothermales bacterium]
MALPGNTEKKKAAVYSEPEIRAWLSWMARGMRAHEQSIFQIENLQPSWLPTQRMRLSYLVQSRLLGGMTIGLVIGLIIGTLDGSYEWYSYGDAFYQDFWDAAYFSYLEGILVSVIVGFSLGLGVLIVDAFLLFNPRTRTKRSAGTLLAYVLAVGSTAGCILGFTPARYLSIFDRFIYDRSWVTDFSLVNEEFLRTVGLDNSVLAFPLIVGTLFGLSIGWAVGRKKQKGLLRADIGTIDLLTWSWRRALFGVFIGLLAGGLIDALNHKFLFTPCIGALGLYGGLQSGIVAMKTRPNQGILLSMRNAAFILLGTVLLVLVIGGYFWFMIDRQTPAGASDELPRHIAVHSAMTFLYFLLFAALFIFGMQDVLQHYILRRMLSKKGMLPFRLV